MKQRVALDSTAVLQRYLPGKYRDLVLSEMGENNYWIATELVKTEILLTLVEAIALTVFKLILPEASVS